MATYPKRYPVLQYVMEEESQGHDTRKNLYIQLEKQIKRPVVSYFTSFSHPVMIEDPDADMLEGILQKIDLTNGLALIIGSPGGDGLTAERIINICRNYSGTNEYWAIVPGKAKSAATMICFGASKILMGASSELGPIDPQITTNQEGMLNRFSVVNIVQSYTELFKQAVGEKKGNLQPYLQQLGNYDAREIKEFEQVIELSTDIALRYLASGMMKGKSTDEIKEKIKMFLSPEYTKIHGRAIYRDEARSCDLEIDFQDIKDRLWGRLYELYIRANSYVSSARASKLIESKNHSFFTGVPHIVYPGE